MFKDRVEHTGKDGGPIEMREVSDLDRAKAMAFLASKAKREVSGKALSPVDGFADLKALLAEMSPEDKADLDKTLKSELSQKWLPQPGPQTEGFSDADLLLYGGAAGGGKSDLLCGLALTQHRRSVIFRRQSTDLDGFWDRLLEISPSNAKSDSNKKRLVTDDNRLIECGHLENPGSELSWQGRPTISSALTRGAAYRVQGQLRAGLAPVG